MTNKLFAALYFGLIIGMSVLFFTNSPVAWVYFGFLFVAVFGGLLYADRPDIISLGFLAASLIVLGTGLFSGQKTMGDWVAVFVGASMTALSVFTFFWVLLHPRPSLKPVNVDKGYNKMDEQEFLHQVSVEYDVNIELLKDLYQNEKLWSLIRADKIIDATVLLRSIQPQVGLREAKRVVEAFAARENR